MREYPVLWRIQWTEVARADLLDIVGYIAQDNPGNALRVANRIDRAAKTLRRFPRRGRRVPELLEGGREEIRQLVLAPWRLMYGVGGSAVTIIAVVDGRRELHEWLARRMLRLTQDEP